MTGLREICDFFWPWLEPFTPEQEEENRQRQERSRVQIAGLDLERDTEIALEEVRRLSDGEAERRRVTEQKAAIYFPLVAALIPLILTLVSAHWEKKVGGAPMWLNMLFLALAVAYTAAAGFWSFRVLAVSVWSEPGAGDFALAWKKCPPRNKPRPAPIFTRRLLLYIQLNFEPLNKKVSALKMAHAHLLRAFLTFSLLLLLNIGWFIANMTISALRPEPASPLDTPRSAIMAVARVSELVQQMQSAPAWMALDADCRRASQGRMILQWKPEARFELTHPKGGLIPAAGGHVSVLKVRLECGGSTIARAKALFLDNNITQAKGSLALPAPFGATAAATITEARAFWPPSTSAANEGSQLPHVLAIQTMKLSGPDGRPVALIVIAITKEVLDPRVQK